MMNIQVARVLTDVNPDINLGVVHAQVSVEKSPQALLDEISSAITEAYNEHNGKDLTKIPQISSLRNTYKLLGKEPSRYRGSAESLLKRINQGKGLYYVNNIVDINNLISVKSRLPVGSYNIKNVDNFIFDVGLPGESYKGIGKDIINIEGLPVFKDSIGAFGSPTSDSERAMINNDCSEIMMIIISFGKFELDKYLELASKMLERYALASIKDIYKVDKDNDRQK